jgi:hypothetical protein
MKFELVFDEATVFTVELKNNDSAREFKIIQYAAPQNNTENLTSFDELLELLIQFDEAIAKSKSFLITSEQKMYLEEKFAAVSVINIDDPIFSVLAKQNNMSIRDVAFMLIAIDSERNAIEPA